MKIIVTMDKHWGLSWKKQPLVRIPADYRFIQEETASKVVVMTREFLDSLPGGKPIVGRTNLVFSKTPGFSLPGIKVFKHVDDLREEFLKFSNDDIYILGGQPLFDEFIDECREIHATWVDYSYMADSFFPDLTKKCEWKLAEKTQEQTYYDLEYYFLRFIRK